MKMSLTLKPEAPPKKMCFKGGKEVTLAHVLTLLKLPFPEADSPQNLLYFFFILTNLGSFIKNRGPVALLQIL